jgi:hypothetical protein
MFDDHIRTYFSSQCIVYDIAQDEYRPLQSSLLGTADSGCAAIDCKLYIVGGEDSTWKTRTDLVQIGRIR